jgi:hypothetical protein
MAKKWDADRVILLRQMWAAEATIEQIARRLHTTQSSVSAKAKHLGLVRRKEAPLGPRNRLIVAFGPRECCWPIGDLRDEAFRFCRLPVCSSGAFAHYCEHHAQMARLVMPDGS